MKLPTLFNRTKVLKTHWPSADEALERFFKDPKNCLYGPSRTDYNWDRMLNMTFSVDGRGMAYVEGINVLTENKIVEIQKFAVENDMLRAGVGRTVVNLIAKEFQGRFGSIGIKFEQSNDSSYPSFFRSLGASPVPGPWTNNPGWDSWVLMF